MSDAGSSVEKPAPPAQPGETADCRADGASSARQTGKPSADQPTIISNRLPTPVPARSDSADRILEGRVMPGDRIGPFELVEYVGGGGMGRVFRAIDTRLGRTVALKVLTPEQAAETDASQRFQNEAQSAARLDHENIARVYGVGEDRGLSYIVFEFVEGVNVRGLVERNGPLPLGEAISYTIQIAEALAHADARSVVHRDIKPSNVLITPEGRVKLIDMGLARLRQVESGGADLTASGVTLGTFDYISPEQARDPRNADVRSDIYSLGCTLFFMLAGQPPFPEGTVLQKLLQHQADEPPDIRQLRPELPEEAGQVLRKMMAKEPRRRYGSPGELATDLLRLAGQVGLQPASPAGRIWLTPPQPSVGFFHRHLPWMAPVTALVCAVLMLHLYWSQSARHDETATPLARAAAGRAAVATQPEKLPQQPTAVPGAGGADHRPSKPPSKDSSRNASRPPSAAPDRPAPPSAAAPQKGLGADSKIAGVGPVAGQGVILDPYLEPGPGPMERGTADKPAAGSGAPPSAAPAAQGGRPADRDAGSPPGKAGPSAEIAPKRSGLLVVSDSAAGADEFSSLGAACAAAQDGDVIELRFNGPREERPMKIANLQLTIRPGEGCQPVIVFRPTEINPVKYPRSMFTLTAGRLTLTDVAVELHVPWDVPADNWSLLETWGGQVLRLERCSLSVRNASNQLTTYHPAAALIRARPAPDADVAVESAPAATPLATIELVDCIARGEAAFLSVEELQPVYLLWDNGLLATSDQLLIAGGGQVAPKPDEMLRLELRHVTAAVRGGLCRLSSTPSNPHQLTVQFVCTDDVILTAPGVPLIEQEGSVSVEKSRQRLLWNGDRNYYQDVDVFWLVRTVDPGVPPEGMTFDAWKTYWGLSRENQPSREPLLWKRGQSADRPLHAHTPADYALEDQAFSGAAAGPPGCRAERLPPLPPEPLPERAPTAGSARNRGAGPQADKS